MWIAVLLWLALGGVCGVAHAAVVPLAESGRALSEEPSVRARTTALSEPIAASREPQWILYLPEGGFTRTPARLSRAYRVDPSRVLLLVQQNVAR